MQRKHRKLVVALTVVAGVVLGGGRGGAAEPDVDLEGSTHVLTFTSPPVYDLSTNDSSSDGAIDHATLVSQDLKGNIEGTIVDKGTHVVLTTDIAGTIRRSGDVTVIKQRQTGEGDLGNGDTLFSRGIMKSVVVQQPGGGAIEHSVLKIKTCAYFKQPFSEKYSKVCSRGDGEHDGPFTRSGDWIVRLDLEQSPSGELSGFGKLVTNVHSSEFARETDVIVTGLAKDEGLAKIKLSPLFAGGDGPVSIVAQINGTQRPAVLFVLSVKGKLLGQKLSETFHAIVD